MIPSSQGFLSFTDAIDGDSAPSYTITSESSNGTASIDATTGAWSYIPNANFNGSDSFTVTVTDDEGHTETQVIISLMSSFSGDTSASVNDPGSFSGVIDGDSRSRQTMVQKMITAIIQARSVLLLMPSTVTLLPVT